MSSVIICHVSSWEVSTHQQNLYSTQDVHWSSKCCAQVETETYSSTELWAQRSGDHVVGASSWGRQDEDKVRTWTPTSLKSGFEDNLYIFWNIEYYMFLMKPQTLFKKMKCLKLRLISYTQPRHLTWHNTIGSDSTHGYGRQHRLWRNISIEVNSVYGWC